MMQRDRGANKSKAQFSAWPQDLPKRYRNMSRQRLGRLRMGLMLNYLFTICCIFTMRQAIQTFCEGNLIA